jgi:4-coumarate--CoA ligase (photoactive yellow protein activation family)
MKIAWWRAAGAMDRFLADLLFAEAQQLRPGGPLPGLSSFQPGAVLGEDGLGFDSLERLAMAASLGEALFLHHGGLDESLVVGDRLESWRDAAAAALDRFSDRIAFHSSGSTGPRRNHAHDRAALEAEVAFFASHLPARRRVVAAVPCHHIYGFLFTLLLPARLGLPVVSVRERFPSAVAAALRPGDLVIGHPVFWADLCRAAPEGWPADIIGVSSGAPCPASTASAAASAGLAQLLDVYGATETSGIGWRTDNAAAYSLLPSWRALDAGTMLQRDDGTVRAVPDHLCWRDESSFMVEGRIDAAVQIAGVNVQPRRVREVLLSHPAVADAAVRLMAPREGSRLKAFIVPRDIATPHAALRQDLASHVGQALLAVERPRAFSFGAAIPSTPSGKPADWPVNDPDS